MTESLPNLFCAIQTVLSLSHKIIYDLQNDHLKKVKIYFDDVGGEQLSLSSHF